MKRAFTLIELLVVIAIIAILAAILFPVFAQAKSAAKKTVGISNFKQSMTAAAMYTGDSDGAHMLANSGELNSYCWGCGANGDTVPYQQMLPYIKNTAISVDPMDPFSERQRLDDHLPYMGANLATSTQQQRDYSLGVRANLGYNYAFFSPWVRRPNDPGGYYTGSGSTTEGQVSNPANTLMFATSIWDRGPNGGAPKGGGNWVIETPCWKDQEGVALEPARSLDMPPTQYVHNYGTGWSNNANDWLVYGGMWPFYNQMPYPGFPGLKDGHVIVAFADTHVKSRPVISTTQGCDAYTDGYQAGRVQDKDKFIWDFE